MQRTRRLLQVGLVCGLCAPIVWLLAFGGGSSGPVRAVRTHGGVEEDLKEGPGWPQSLHHAPYRTVPEQGGETGAASQTASGAALDVSTLERERGGGAFDWSDPDIRQYATEMGGRFVRCDPTRWIPVGAMVSVVPVNDAAPTSMPLPGSGADLEDAERWLFEQILSVHRVMVEASGVLVAVGAATGSARLEVQGYAVVELDWSDIPEGQVGVCSRVGLIRSFGGVHGRVVSEDGTAFPVVVEADCSEASVLVEAPGEFFLLLPTGDCALRTRTVPPCVERHGEWVAVKVQPARDVTGLRLPRPRRVEASSGRPSGARSHEVEPCGAVPAGTGADGP